MGKIHFIVFFIKPSATPQLMLWYHHIIWLIHTLHDMAVLIWKQIGLSQSYSSERKDILRNIHSRNFGQNLIWPILLTGTLLNLDVFTLFPLSVWQEIVFHARQTCKQQTNSLSETKLLWLNNTYQQKLHVIVQSQN